MSMNKFDFKFNYHVDTLSNGLNVIVIEKPLFKKVSAFFTTNYGSIDINLIDKVTKENKTFPEGITHFLEHIVFHIDDDKDATVLFEALGAEVNAYTSKTQTTYYFNTVSNVDECLNLLLDFVQTPYFSDKIVDNERKIIEQEINMINDNFDEQLSSGLLQNLFHKCPLKNEIGGTVDTIKDISKELLNEAYEYFYHPTNMTLVVIGGVNYNHILDVIRKNQSDKKFNKLSELEILYPKEEHNVVKSFSSDSKDLMIPKTSIGLKLNFNHLKNDEFFRTTFAFGMLMNYYFQYTGVYYNVLENKKLMNDSFNYVCAFYKLAQYIEFSIDILEVDKFNDKFKKLLLNIKEDKIDLDKFIKIKNKFYAGFVHGMNNYEYIKNVFDEYLHRNITPEVYLDTIINLTIEDLEDVKKYINEECITINTFYKK